MNTRELLAMAYERGGFQSWRALARAVDIAPSAIVRVRRGHGLPSDETCAALAAIAGIDPYTALMQLNIERSEGHARRIYEKALKAHTPSSIAAE